MKESKSASRLLATVTPRLQAVIDACLPPSLRQSEPQQRRVARLTLVFAACLFIWAPIYAVVYAVLGAWDLAVWVGVAGVVVGLAPVTLYRTARPAWAAHQTLIGLSAVLLAITTHTGGLTSSAMPWFPTLPLMAMALLGLRGAVVWAAAALSFVGCFAVAALAGFVFPNVLDGTAVVISLASTFPGVTLFVFSLAASFELTKNQMAAELSAERAAAERARDAARRILDVVDQGLFVVDARGFVKAELSATAVRWFGAPPEDRPFWTWLTANDDDASWLSVCHEALRDELLPREVLLAQMPTTLHRALQTFRLQWQLAPGDDLLVVVTDVTLETAAARTERVQRELVESVQALAADRSGFFEFLDEAEAIIGRLTSGESDGERDGANAQRDLHTLKGNSALFKFGALAEACHAIEDRVVDVGHLTTADRNQLDALWRQMLRGLAPFIETRDRGTLEVRRDELLAALSSSDSAELRRRVAGWLHEPARVRLERAGRQAQGLAQKLGKPEPRVVVHDDGVVLDAARWSRFWSSFVHAVRNAADHGLEADDERRAAGKPAAGTLTLRARNDGNDVVISVSDDGRGIDWAAVIDSARRRGHDVVAGRDDVEALFKDGVSTAASVTDVSGRGVGMSALREAVTSLGGSIRVMSERGRGTTFEFRVPTSSNVAARAA